VDREEIKVDFVPGKCFSCSKNDEYLYFWLKAYSIKLICLQKLLRLANNFF